MFRCRTVRNIGWFNLPKDVRTAIYANCLTLDERSPVYIEFISTTIKSNRSLSRLSQILDINLHLLRVSKAVSLECLGILYAQPFHFHGPLALSSFLLRIGQENVSRLQHISLGGHNESDAREIYPIRNYQASFWRLHRSMALKKFVIDVKFLDLRNEFSRPDLMAPEDVRSLARHHFNMFYIWFGAMWRMHQSCYTGPGVITLNRGLNENFLQVYRNELARCCRKEWPGGPPNFDLIRNPPTRSNFSR